MIVHVESVLGKDWRWPSFAPDEPNLACPCCGEFFWDTIAMDMLQAVRTDLGRPVKVNSGHRCKLHNARVGGAPRSQHKLAVAWDISLVGHDRFEVLTAARRAGFTTFGFYQTFLHVDRRRGRRWYAGSYARRLWNAA